MKFFKFFGFVLMLAFITGCAFTSNEVKTEKARAIYFVPKNVDSEILKNALRDAISGRVSNVKEVCNLMPEELPDKPAKPTTSNVFGNLMTIAAGNPKIEAMR